MLKTIIWKDTSPKEQARLLQRSVKTDDLAFTEKVKQIIQSVRFEGDVAIKRLTKIYDGVDLAKLQVSQVECENARDQVKEAELKAMERAISNIRKFHELQKPVDIKVKMSLGVTCESLAKPIQRVGLYIPSGTAPLISTVLMLGVPAEIAGCPTRILCSPPRKDGTLDPHIIIGAKLCGVEKIYKIGGAQAIAAMAYGTETVPKVDKIFGPGNSYVTQAKMMVAQDPVGALCDLPAGPSEVMVIADKTANPEFVAADLLSQAEHGVDSQVILICTDSALIDEIGDAMMQQMQFLPRSEFIIQALTHSRALLVDTIGDAIAVVNDYAPEHLILQVRDPRSHLDAIQNAGSVFLGPWSPESVGDYASGTNHVLPTYGYAKSLSGLSVRDFMKMMTVQELSKEGLSSIAETVKTLARIEGLMAHEQAVSIRFSGGDENVG